MCLSSTQLAHTTAFARAFTLVYFYTVSPPVKKNEKKEKKKKKKKTRI